MTVKLIKPYVLVKKELPIGTEIEVTNGVGEDLINRKIGLDITLKVRKSEKKKEDAELKKTIEILEAVSKIQEEEEIKEKAEKISKKINKKNTKKS